MALLFSHWLFDLLSVLGVLFISIYLYFKRSYKYWEKRGISVPRAPSFPYGHFQGLSVVDTMSGIIGTIYNETCKNSKEKMFGIYFFQKPLLIPRDLDTVKNILIKDFTSFHDRGVEFNLENDPLAGHLFMMNGQEWRNMRVKLTPTFTSGKMRFMFSTLLEVGEQLSQVLDNAAEEDEIEIKEILSCFTTDVISSVAFGLDTNSLQNPDSVFRKMGKQAATPSLRQRLAGILIMTMPKSFVKRFPFRFFPENMTDFFVGTVRDVLTYREENNVKRNDFMQLLYQLKTLGYIPDADNPNKEEDANNATKFTIEQAAAQAFLFFAAGFETSSSTMTFALYELAVNLDLQKQVQEDVDNSVNKYGGITYDSLQEMDLLDRVVSETLRKYPVAGIIIRECSKDYKVPDSNIEIKKGESIWMPSLGYHMDPEHFPDPEKFDPDRFLPEIKAKRHPMAYLPFGDGPRSCIGNRFALMQVKAGLAIIISKFCVSPSKRTQIPLVMDPKTDLLSPKGGLYFKIYKRSQ